MSASREKLKRIGSCFDRIHTTLGCLREHLDAVNDDEANRIYTQMEFGTLAPMRRLRQHLQIPYNWQENPEYQQEVVDDGPGNEDTGGELLCEQS